MLRSKKGMQMNTRDGIRNYPLGAFSHEVQILKREILAIIYIYFGGIYESIDFFMLHKKIIHSQVLRTLFQTLWQMEDI